LPLNTPEEVAEAGNDIFVSCLPTSTLISPSSSQRPDATRVVGYGTWQELGRLVKKEIKMLVPYTPRITPEQEEGGRNRIFSMSTA
jgi:hypothetical protein